MDISNGFYMAKFDIEPDRAHVMEDGPWMLFNHYLTVLRRSPEFASPTAKIDRTLVWIWFPSLNLVFYDESVLMAMAIVVRRPVIVDANTRDVWQGRFARMCIEVDLDKPMVGLMWFHGH